MAPVFHYPIFLITGKTGFFSGPPEAVKGALLRVHRRTLDGEDDRTRWLARKMGRESAG
jgi:hypothetical protein